MVFDVVSTATIRRMTRPSPYAVISITKPRNRRIALRTDPNRLATLWRMFDDVGFGHEAVRDSRYSYFSPSDADAILDFWERYRASVGTFVVHCDDGSSRCDGVALALALIAEAAPARQALGFPNPLIVRTILQREAERRRTTFALPVVVRYVGRCPRHPEIAARRPLAENEYCERCGAALESVPVDIMTDRLLDLPPRLSVAPRSTGLSP